MANVLEVGPATEPVSLTEAKLHLRVDGNDENTLVTALIIAARQTAEAYTRRAFVTQTWCYICDRLSGTVTLSYQPIQSVASVTVDGEELDETAYEVDIATGRIRVFGSYIASSIGGIIITYDAGYGVADAVPQAIKQAILLMVGHWYENREAITTSSAYELPLAAKVLLAPYQVMLL